jgi:hypothetical protein
LKKKLLLTYNIVILNRDYKFNDFICVFNSDLDTHKELTLTSKFKGYLPLILALVGISFSLYSSMLLPPFTKQFVSLIVSMLDISMGDELLDESITLLIIEKSIIIV